MARTGAAVAHARTDGLLATFNPMTGKKYELGYCTSSDEPEPRAHRCSWHGDMNMIRPLRESPTALILVIIETLSSAVVGLVGCQVVAESGRMAYRAAIALLWFSTAAAAGVGNGGGDGNTEEDAEKSKELSRSSACRCRGSSRSHRLDLLLLVRSPRRTPTPISTANQWRLYRYPHEQCRINITTGEMIFGGSSDFHNSPGSNKNRD
uniref:OJ1005_B10.11 protein n=1 Tax=Oryza sativa subsp. japonica TaxID=39947 RepID=Q7EZP1_ORYSJ|nr:OJ1005_B10.11 [Oryza sativa Japonica Group]